MKRYLSQLMALLCVVAIALVGCSGTTLVKGDYRQDTLDLVNTLRTAIELPEDSPEQAELQAQARQQINDYASRYRRDSSVANLSSFTTMRTALNAIAGHYSSFPDRPLPDKTKQRLAEEFQRVEVAINRDN